jgi:hypothetical protein
VEVAVVVLLGVVGVTQCLPGLLVLAPERIPATYGVEVAGPDLALLLRHRAVLLALPGVLVLVSIAVEDLRWAATVTCLASMASFAVLLARTPGAGRQNRRVGRVDVVAVAALVVVMVLMSLD